MRLKVVRDGRLGLRWEGNRYEFKYTILLYEPRSASYALRVVKHTEDCNGAGSEPY